MRETDFEEVRRRLDEVQLLYEAGYDPFHAYGEALWEKCHAASLHTHRGALLDIEEDQRPARGP